MLIEFAAVSIVAVVVIVVVVIVGILVMQLLEFVLYDWPLFEFFSQRKKKLTKRLPPFLRRVASIVAAVPHCALFIVVACNSIKRGNA